MVQIPEEIAGHLAQLKEAVRGSAVWQRYNRVREELMQSPETFAVINDFRKANYLLTTEADGDTDFEARNREMYLSRSKLVTNPVIAEYLDAELELCILMRKILCEISDIAQLDLDTVESTGQGS